MNQDLIQLLEEAATEIQERFKVSDDAVADYKQDLDVAYRFIQKALETEDRLDIFTALEKAYDVLQTEDEDDELANRIKDSMNENVLTKESLKKLVNLVLTEIKLGMPSKYQENPLVGFFNMANDARESHPSYKLPKVGYGNAHKLLKYVQGLARKILADVVRGQDTDYDTGNFDHTRDILVGFMHHWTAKFYHAAQDKRVKYELISNMNEFMSHMNEIGNQLENIAESLKNKNFAVAHQQINHLNDIIENASSEIDGIFSIGKV